MNIYTAKKSVFNYLTKTQKSNLCHYIASFVKKYYKQEVSEILNKFLDDEKYYLEINASRLPWLEEVIDSEEFLKELELYIKANQKNCFYKEKQRPIYEQQKKHAKEQRKKAQEWKMSKQRASKVQVKYYKALCKRYKIENPIDLETASKLDLKNAISEILDKNKENEKELLQERLNKKL